jgi:L-asparaginase / beta-aspartyl-peptidase
VKAAVPLALALALGAGVAAAQPAPQWSIALHGGAGVIERGDLDPATEAAYRKALAGAL